MEQFTRFWNETVAGLIEATPGGLIVLIILALIVAAVMGGLIYWLATARGSASGAGGRGGRGRWRWPRFGALRLRWRWRWPWRRRRRTGGPDELDLPPDQLPDLPAATLTMTADEYAAAGRYAEAVRERLRAIVRDLIEREVIAHRPGWTVTELARAAGAARPATAGPLDGASAVFSEIWYGLRAATAADDAAMRAHATAVRSAVAELGTGVPR
jgi:hypothetical protein